MPKNVPTKWRANMLKNVLDVLNECYDEDGYITECELVVRKRKTSNNDPHAKGRRPKGAVARITTSDMQHAAEQTLARNRGPAK